MLKVSPGPAWPLFSGEQTRALENTLRNQLPPSALMQRAGLATARLALAIAPHANKIWIACGPGNNGGDGLEAAGQLKRWGKQPLVTWLGRPQDAPEDARTALDRATAAGVTISPVPPADCDLCIDALLGLGVSRAASGPLAQQIEQINALAVPILAVDLPSGLHGDTGTCAGAGVRATHTLSLLTLKPGLFTAQGRDLSGQVWFDDLEVSTKGLMEHARLNPKPIPLARPHASHKGNFGDLAVVGGAPGMTGAAILAATAALAQGPGRVFVGLLSPEGQTPGGVRPDLMLRPVDALELGDMTVVCGCGGGQAVAGHLPRILSRAKQLVLDADALNAIASDSQLQSLLRARQGRHYQTVLTPHPLEAARLLNCSVAEVQGKRLEAATRLAESWGCVIVLKGSGTVIAAPDNTSVINLTGNARLATAGTGDVLAGMLGARMAQSEQAFAAACAAVWLHGLAADQWPSGQALTASALAAELS